MIYRMNKYLLALDQGTTSTRAILFTPEGTVVAVEQLSLQQYFPQDGWVEHDAEEIWSASLQVLRAVLQGAQLSADQVAALGITNQRETTIIWDKQTGQPLHRAIVWQDRRTTDYCHQLVSQGHELFIQQKTGLLIDPYFSASKLHWLLNNVPNALSLIEQQRLAFGTVDSFLLWKLTNGRVHATDATNAARTMLFNIHTQQWDQELLTLFNIPESILPEVKDSCADFGVTDADVCGMRLTIGAVMGDQQAAAVGQACFKPGMIKSTYGTGCFLLVNTGEQPVLSQHRLLTTVAYRLNGKATYALEGSIFVAGAAVQWLRDTLKLIHSVQDSQTLAEQTPTTGGVYLVPAFTGLGAPYWDPLARGAILGLTRDSGVQHIVRAALESVCYQTRDLLAAIQEDWGAEFRALRVDGGMATNDWVMQFLADILNIKVERPSVTETTALGAAYFAGLQVGVYSSLEKISELWQLQTTFTSQMQDAQRQQLYQGWLHAVARIRG
jgi:glycerol kinase